MTGAGVGAEDPEERFPFVLRYKCGKPFRYDRIKPVSSRFSGKTGGGIRMGMR